MSHRVTTQTEIKDKGLAIQALKQAGFAYEDMGSSLRITSGPIANATIDLTSGLVGGDTDHGHRRGDDSLGILKRYYAEAKYVQECAIQGISQESRGINQHGEVEIVWQGHFA